MLVVQDMNFDNFLNYPNNGTGDRVGCINPLRLPTPNPIQRPKREEDIMQFLLQAAFDKSNLLHLNTGMDGKFKSEVTTSADAKEQNFPSPLGKYSR